MSRFATLDSIKKKGRGGDDDEDDDGNEYYAGGAGGHGGGSGLNVVGGGRRDDGTQDEVSRILERARREAEAGQVIEDEENLVTVTFYRNGFTVDNGPFRPLGTPENDAFLQSVSMGFCPDELVVDGKPSNITIQDKRGEDYVPPPYVAFGGSGQAVGTGETSRDEDTVIAPDASAAAPTVNEGEDTIRVQIKYPGNKRQVAKFNRHHTVQDLVNFIHSSGNVSEPFILLHSAPPRPLRTAEFGENLIDAKLAGASVTVKLV